MAAQKTGAPKRRPSGPSGQNTKPGYLLRATPEEFAAWREQAERSGQTLNQWIRDRCNGTPAGRRKAKS